MSKCFEPVKCSKCNREADKFCGACVEWHCVRCYLKEVNTIAL